MNCLNQHNTQNTIKDDEVWINRQKTKWKVEIKNKIIVFMFFNSRHFAKNSNKTIFY